MSGSKKSKYLTKVVKFGRETVTLYSLDGMTWSTRRSELMAIKERIENQRVTLNLTKEDVGAPQAAQGEEQLEEDIADDDISGGAANEKVVETDSAVPDSEGGDEEEDAPVRSQTGRPLPKEISRHAEAKRQKTARPLAGDEKRVSAISSVKSSPRAAKQRMSAAKALKPAKGASRKGSALKGKSQKRRAA